MNVSKTSPKNIKLPLIMQSIVNYKAGKPQIDKLQAFTEATKEVSFEAEMLMKDLMSKIDKMLLEEEPSIQQGAFNNGHGAWFEWCIGLIALIVSQQRKDFVLVPLPNVRQYNVFKLYSHNIYNLVSDLQSKVKKSYNVNFVTSNPDFVILRYKGNSLEGFLESSTKEKVELLRSWHLRFDTQCEFEDVVGFLSVKHSLRPDRRLQIAHEGSLMKAIYTHIQTRLWLPNAQGFKYFAMSGSQVSEADRHAMATIATHSITSVQSIPQPAVDGLFEGTSFLKIKSSIELIFNALAKSLDD